MKEVVRDWFTIALERYRKACQSIYLLHEVFVRKVEMLKKAGFASRELMELHGEGSGLAKAPRDETGARVG